MSGEDCYYSGETPQVGDEVVWYSPNTSPAIRYTVSEVNSNQTQLRTVFTKSTWFRALDWRLLRRPALQHITPKVEEMKPNYYQFTVRGHTLDVTDMIQALNLGFEAGNVVKYIARAGRKDATKEIEDLKKAREYIDRLIAFRTTERT